MMTQAIHRIVRDAQGVVRARGPLWPDVQRDAEAAGGNPWWMLKVSGWTVEDGPGVVTSAEILDRTDNQKSRSAVRVPSEGPSPYLCGGDGGMRLCRPCTCWRSEPDPDADQEPVEVAPPCYHHVTATAFTGDKATIVTCLDCGTIVHIGDIPWADTP